MLHSRNHDHHHGHGHGGHAHGHAPRSFGSAFALGIALNTGFVAVEAAFGVLGHSMALLADAGHNLGDVLGLAVAWGAAVLSQRRPTARYTYGLRSSSILAALVNAVVLLVAMGAILLEAARRLAAPEPVAGKAVIIVAAIGILINGATAWLFASGRKGDINIKGAFLHMAADAAISLGVVLAGIAILVTGWLRLDPAVSLVIAATIVWGTWGLLRDSVNMSLAAVPPGIEPAEVHEFFERLPGVSHVHDLHIWAMSTTETALTCHLVMPSGHPGDEFVLRIMSELRNRFGIRHATVQIETSEEVTCALAPEHVV
ncbi:MAG TPA: cation diffusion facilitator family transporter [Stellaceae bacterium]|nr:cation diffusion facilitator family transporter [Stellaceae bacterium]